MADSRIHDLTALASLAVGDLFAADDASSLAAASGKVTAQQIIDLASSELLIDEDDMVTNSATKAPSQQSVKAYVDTEVAAVSGGSGTIRNTHAHTVSGALSVARAAADQATIATISANATSWANNLTTDQDLLWLVLKGDGGSTNYTANLSTLSDRADLESAGGLGGTLPTTLNIYPDTYAEILIRRIGGVIYGDLDVLDIGTPVASTPGAPTSINATPGNTVIDVSWSAPTDNGGAAITQYRVGYRVTGGGSYTYTADLGTVLAHQITGLTNAQEYDIVVQAKNTLGYGTLSTAVFATPAVAASISLRSSTGQGNITGSTYTSVSVPLPASISAGDLIEILVGGTDADVGAPSAATATGYTQRHTGLRAVAFWPRMTKLYKIAAGTEGGTSVTVSWTTESTRWSYMVNVWSGVDNATPYDTALVAAPDTSSTNPDPASITTVTNDALVVVQMTGMVVVSAAAATITGYTSVHDDSADGAASFCCLTKSVATAGAEDPPASVWASASGAYLVTDALRPA